MICPKCGKENHNVKYCTECGTFLEENKKNRKPLIIIFGILVLMIIIAIAIVFIFKFKKTDNNMEENTIPQYGKPLSGVITFPEEKDADNDADGIINTEERKIGTNVESADTDDDGISDYYEIHETKTDPLKIDTDGDGLNDGDELDMSLDPLKKDSKGDGITDGNRALSTAVTDKTNGIKMEISGKGNIASSTVDIIENNSFNNTKGLLNKIYNLYSLGKIDDAKVTIPYSLDEIKSKGIDEDNLTLFNFNEETKRLEKVPTKVDKKNKNLIVDLNHFSLYVVGDKNKAQMNHKTDIMFVIDNSVSMYTADQLMKAGQGWSIGSVGNDYNFKRLILSKKMVDMFTGDYKFGVAEFSGNYVNLLKFTNNTTSIKNSIDSMNTNWKSNLNGTNIVDALKNGLAEFSSSKEDKHYLILITDGKNTNSSLNDNKNLIISTAKKNKVHICTIGIGYDIDTQELTEISEKTGCKYFHAGDASALDEIYTVIGADINFNLVDTDNDNKTESMIDANSGFLVNRDGFSFKNIESNKSNIGHCYGMATFAMLHYQDKLPVSLPAKDNSKYYRKLKKIVDFASNGYDLTDTYFTKKGNKLYDFKFTNPELSIIFGNAPSGYRDRIENNTYMISKKYADKFLEMGQTFYNYKMDGDGYTHIQRVLLNIENDKLKNAVSNDEYQVLSAIWRLFILQSDDERTSFSANPDKAFNELKSNLYSGNPIVLHMKNGDDQHAVNAIRLIQDITDPNKFKIEIYDNNHPGETKYINVTRSKIKWYHFDVNFIKNEYNYKFQYDMDGNGSLDNISVHLSNAVIN